MVLAEHDETDPRAGWRDRVEFSVDGGVFAYRPGEVLVRSKNREAVQQALRRLIGDNGVYESHDDLGYVRAVGDFDVLVAVGNLRHQGFVAQPNHVLFADAGHQSAHLMASGLAGNPFSGNPFSGNPFSGNPFSGNPFSGNPFSGNPFSGNPAPGGSGHISYGNPAFGHPRTSDLVTRGTGRCLARPADPLPEFVTTPSAGGSPAVAVLDVGLPHVSFRPPLVAGCESVASDALSHGGVPDFDVDGFLDRVAGHGMFVAGCVAQVCPTSAIRVVDVLANHGDGDEWHIAKALEALKGTVDIVNLSFSGYALEAMEALGEALRVLQTHDTPASRGQGGVTRAGRGAVIVTSAGNDSTWLAPYPAAFPGVISVAALGPDGPAAFTNYGPWVRACAAGVDVRSTYYLWHAGKEHRYPEGDPDRFEGAATWSGTSFAAPLVAGKLAALVHGGLLPKQAARQLLDRPGLARLPWLGTIVTA